VKAPGKNDTYCEKNWMPIKDMPYHYMRTSNPTEIVQVDPTTGDTNIVVSKERKSHLLDEHFDMLRGSSQVIPWKDYHMALVHTCELWLTANDRKYARYCHCFVVWDKDWDIVKVSPLFSFADYNVEFTCGLEYKDGYFYIPFALQDDFSFLMRVDEDTVWNFITNTNTDDADTTPFVGQPGRFDVIFNPHADQKTLFNVGMKYYSERNFAAAYCIFMRSADMFEYTYDERFMAARSIADLGHRDSHESGMWNLAIMHDRKRPEAYMSEAMYYHCRGRHPEALYYATLAMENRNNVDHLLYINDESMEYFNNICRYESVHYPEVLPYFDAHGMKHNQNRRVL
jgi:hypothetical protein